MKLVLSSFNTTDAQDEAVAQLIGKPPHATRVGYIENAYDIYDDEASLLEGRDVLKAKGYDYRFLYTLNSGHTDPKVFENTLADTLVWMWRGYHAE